MNAKRGRPRKLEYVTSWGETIHGAYEGSDGRLRPIGLSKPAFGGDESAVVNAFRAWKAKRDGTPWERHIPTITKVYNVPLPDADQDVEIEAISKKYDDTRKKRRDVKSKDKTDVTSVGVYADSAEAYKSFIRNLILSNPKAAAVELGIPHLADYPAKPDKPNFTLKELGSLYVRNKRNRRGGPLDMKYKKNLEAWWNEFIEIVNWPSDDSTTEPVTIRYARDLTQERFTAYYHEIMARFQPQAGSMPRKPPEDAEGISATYVRSRFAAVKAILKYGIDFTDDKKDCRAALDCCAILRSPPERSNPTPMKPNDWHKLFISLRPDVDSDIRLLAIMLLAMNCAMHNGEAGWVLKKNVDLDQHTFSADRHKSGIPRVAKLWPRTVQAIRDYQARYPHPSPYLFASRSGTKLSGESIRQLFVTLRNRAGVSENVTFEWIRDGAYTCAFKENPVYATWIGGHAAWTGMPSDGKVMSNKYVERSPEDPNVVACCEAIERYYFTGMPENCIGKEE